MDLLAVCFYVYICGQRLRFTGQQFFLQRGGTNRSIGTEQSDHGPDFLIYRDNCRYDTITSSGDSCLLSCAIPTATYNQNEPGSKVGSKCTRMKLSHPIGEHLLPFVSCWED